MLAVTWRVAHGDWDVDAFIARHRLRRVTVYHRGEDDLLGRRRERSGFNLSINRDDDSLAHAIADLRRFLGRRRPALLQLRRRGIGSTIDIGVTVGDSTHFARSVHLPADLLAALARAGIDLEVSAYPTAEGCPEGPPGLAPAGTAPRGRVGPGRARTGATT